LPEHQPYILTRHANSDTAHHFIVSTDAGLLIVDQRKVPTALADHVERNGLQGKLKFNLFVGASSGAETENRWARLNMIEKRAPHQVGKDIARQINAGLYSIREMVS
jgi:acyl-CoA hydrolase